MINNRKLLKDLSDIFNVNEKDMPKTIQRFKSEAEEFERQLKKSRSG
jgi:hypothetical protein